MKSFEKAMLFRSFIGLKSTLSSRVVLAMLALVALVAVPTLPVSSAQAYSLPATRVASKVAPSTTPGCSNGKQSSGALYRVCFPATWNGDVIVYAHGSIDPRAPLVISDPVVTPGPPAVTLSQLLLGQGFAFATSSYSKNGLAILEGLNDLQDVVHIFKTRFATPHRVYMVGFSEGGLISALSVERMPDVYNGGIAGCGDVGSVRAGVNYVGDVRVIFDYFFPNLIPGTGTSVPSTVTSYWATLYGPAIKAALLAHPEKLRQIMSVAGIPVQTSGGAGGQADVVVSILHFEVTSVGSYMSELGGSPYDNVNRVYRGSDNDVLLNLLVQRYKAGASALQLLNNYDTSGNLARPLVTMHTTRDWLVLFDQEAMYSAKAGSNPQHVNIPVDQDGHCTFDANKLAQALKSLLLLAQ